MKEKLERMLELTENGTKCLCDVCIDVDCDKIRFASHYNNLWLEEFTAEISFCSAWE